MWVSAEGAKAAPSPSRVSEDAASVGTNANSKFSLTDSSDFSPCSSSGGGFGGGPAAIPRVGSPQYPFTRPTSPSASAAPSAERRCLLPQQQRPFCLPAGSITRRRSHDESLFSEDGSSSTGCSPASGAASVLGALSFAPVPPGDSPCSAGGGLVRRLTLDLGGQSPQGVGGGERLAGGLARAGGMASAHAVYAARLQMAVLRSSQPSLALMRQTGSAATSAAGGGNGEQLLSSIAAAEDAGPLMRPPAEFGAPSLGALSIEGLVNAAAEDKASSSGGESGERASASELWGAMGAAPGAESAAEFTAASRACSSRASAGDDRPFDAPAAVTTCFQKNGVETAAGEPLETDKRGVGGGEFGASNFAAASRSPAPADSAAGPRLRASCCASNGDKELSGGLRSCVSDCSSIGAAASRRCTDTPEERPPLPELSAVVDEPAGRPSVPAAESAGPFDLLLSLGEEAQTHATIGDSRRPPPPSTFQVTDDSVCFGSGGAAKGESAALCGPASQDGAPGRPASSAAAPFFACLPSVRGLPCFTNVPSAAGAAAGVSAKAAVGDGVAEDEALSPPRASQLFFPVGDDPSLCVKPSPESLRRASSLLDASPMAPLQRAADGGAPSGEGLSCVPSPRLPRAGEVSSGGGVEASKGLLTTASAFSPLPAQPTLSPPLYLPSAAPALSAVSSAASPLGSASLFASPSHPTRLSPCLPAVGSEQLAAAVGRRPSSQGAASAASAARSPTSPSASTPEEASPSLKALASPAATDRAAKNAAAAAQLSPIVTSSDSLFQHPTPAFIDYCIKKHLPSNPNPDNLPGIQLERQQKRWCASVYFRGNQFKKRFSSGRWGVLGAFYAAIEWRQVQCKKFQKLRGVCGGGSTEEAAASSSGNGGRREGFDVSLCGVGEEGLASLGSSPPAATMAAASGLDERNNSSTGAAASSRLGAGEASSAGGGTRGSGSSSAKKRRRTTVPNSQQGAATAVVSSLPRSPSSQMVPESSPPCVVEVDACSAGTSGRSTRRRTARSAGEGGRRGVGISAKTKAPPPPLLPPSPSLDGLCCAPPSPVEAGSGKALATTNASSSPADAFLSPPPFGGKGGGRLNAAAAAAVAASQVLSSPSHELAGTPRGPCLQQLGVEEAEFELSRPDAAQAATAAAVRNWKHAMATTSSSSQGSSCVLDNTSSDALWKTAPQTALAANAPGGDAAASPQLSSLAAPVLNAQEKTPETEAAAPLGGEGEEGGGGAAAAESEGGALPGASSSAGASSRGGGRGSRLCLGNNATEDVPTDDTEVERLFDGEEIKWFEGFRLPFGTEGRNQLLRRLRQLYHSNAAYWSGQLEQQRIAFSRVPFATVPELWKIAHIMGCFRFALHLSHKYAGGGSGRHAAASAGALSGGNAAAKTSLNAAAGTGAAAGGPSRKTSPRGTAARAGGLGGGGPSRVSTTRAFRTRATHRQGAVAGAPSTGKAEEPPLLEREPEAPAPAPAAAVVVQDFAQRGGGLGEEACWAAAV